MNRLEELIQAEAEKAKQGHIVQIPLSDLEALYIELKELRGLLETATAPIETVEVRLPAGSVIAHHLLGTPAPAGYSVLTEGPQPSANGSHTRKPYTRTKGLTEREGSVQQGAAIAILADGGTTNEAAYQSGLNERQCRSLKHTYKANIDALAALPAGEARFKYLQKWFGFGMPKVKTP